MYIESLVSAAEQLLEWHVRLTSNHSSGLENGQGHIMLRDGAAI